ncbi:hypothetical protein NEPAR04_2450 [Nematocida parisii]|nr:hypothetical protein NEPAR03_0507 [Nematocida parisii]KAI5128259.1 hypothetical protein NEPAR08_1123 [Nematocida parisii]KAI5145438.1 hypothetical protein NEPAR04_2450 [Nematocida parisii]
MLSILKNKFLNNNNKNKKSYEEIIDKITIKNQKEMIFDRIPTELLNLTYNLLYISINTNYNKNNIDKTVNNSFNHTKTIIEVIMKLSERIINKKLFYNIIGNNHIIALNAYRIIHSEQVSNEKSEESILKLMELTEDQKYSKLQRALDIVSMGIPNLSKEDKDIMMTFKLIDYTKLSEFISGSVYGSIYNSKNGIKSYSIYNIHRLVYNMAIRASINTESKLNEMITHLDLLYTADEIAVAKDIRESDVLNSIKDKAIMDKVVNNVINNYFNGMKPAISELIKKEAEGAKKIQDKEVRERHVGKMREEEIKKSEEEIKKKREKEEMKENLNKVEEETKNIWGRARIIRDRINNIWDGINNINNANTLRCILIVVFTLNFISIIYYNESAPKKITQN